MPTATRRWLAAAATALLLASAADAGTIRKRTFPSRVLHREYAYAVYLPDGYDAGGRRYPVLYLLHGADADEDEWVRDGGIRERVDALIAAGAIPPALVVMPGQRDSWWVDGAGEKGETAFFAELLPDVAKNFRTLGTRSGRAVAGISAGGYGAVRYALKHPDLFGAAAALSPAVYEDEPPADSLARRLPPFLGPDGKFRRDLWRSLNYPALLDGYAAQPSRVPLYIVSGDRDALGIAAEAKALFRRMHAIQPGMTELHIVRGGHDWSVWTSTIGDAMRYMFRFVSGPSPDALPPGVK